MPPHRIALPIPAQARALIQEETGCPRLTWKDHAAVVEVCESFRNFMRGRPRGTRAGAVLVAPALR